MPAQSQQQQKLFGLALSVKRGDTPRSEASKEVLKIVDTMTEKEIEDIAGTEHEGLPKKVEQKIREMARQTIREQMMGEAKFNRGDMVRVIDNPKYVMDKKKFAGKSGYVKNIMGSDVMVKFPNGRTILVDPKDLEMNPNESVNEAKFKKGDKVIVDNPWGRKPIKGVIDFTIKTPKGDVYILKGDNGVWDEKYISLQESVNEGDTLKQVKRGNSIILKKGNKIYATISQNPNKEFNWTVYFKKGGALSGYKTKEDAIARAQKMSDSFKSAINKIKGESVNEMLNVGDVISVDGFVMLKGLDGGNRYKVIKTDNISYTFKKMGSTKKVRHYKSDVDGWLKMRDKKSPNRIVKEVSTKESVDESVNDGNMRESKPPKGVNLSIVDKEIKRRGKANMLKHFKDIKKNKLYTKVNTPKSIDYLINYVSNFNESVNEAKYTDQTGIKSSLIRNSEFFSLLNQKEKNWIRGNDVKIYKDRFGFIFTDGKMEMVANLKKPMSIIKSLGRARNEIKKLYNQNESVNEASGEFVVYVEKDNGRKKLLHTKKSQRAANMFMSKNMDKILNKSGIRSIGSMSKDQWEKKEAQFAENIKKKDMKTVTKKEWDRTHKDYKGMIKGQPYMMWFDKQTQSTVYGPVHIKD